MTAPDWAQEALGFIDALVEPEQLLQTTLETQTPRPNQVGVITTPFGAEGHFKLAEWDLATVSPEAYIWVPSAASAVLGFPLKVSHPRSAVHELSRNDEEEPWNSAAQAIFFEHDTASSAFGHRQSFTWHGSAVFARTDGKDMDGLQLRLLVNYITDEMGPFVKLMSEISKSEADRQSARITAVKRFEPNAFHTYFEEHSRRYLLSDIAKESDQPPKSELLRLLNIPSPVEVTGIEVKEACGSCYSTVGNKSPQAPLLRCSRCRQRHYCNPYCQRQEWKGHSRVCTQLSRVQAEASARAH